MPSSLAPSPRTVLFVCTGNVCRSPFAERFAQAISSGDSQWRYTSSGTRALTGARMDRQMAAQLRQHGGDPEGFRARALTRDVLAEADLVVTMECAQRDAVLEDHPNLATVTFTLGQLNQTLSRLPADVTLDDLAAQLRTRRAPALPADDVRDPMGRARRVAAATSEHLVNTLRVLVPALESIGARSDATA